MLRAVSLLAAVIILTTFFFRRSKHAQQRKLEDDFAAQHGALPIQAYTKGSWPLNLDLVWGLLKSLQEGRILQYQGKFLDALGPNLEQRLLGDVGLVTIDPANVEAILGRNNFQDYVFGQRRDAFLPQLGEGLFTQDGAPWKRSRELLRKQFARIQYSNNLSIFSSHVDLLVARLSKLPTSTPVDLMPLFFNFTLDTTTHLLFGRSAGSLHEDTHDHFGASFDEASSISALRVKLVHLYWLYSPPRYYRACAQVKAYADAFINEAISAAPDATPDADPYLFIRSLYADLQDRTLVRDQLINVLLAGRDTTAALLSWTFRLLLRDPASLHRLRTELTTHLGPRTALAKSDLPHLPYLRAVLDETLRLYPSVPINVRTARRPTLLPTGGGPARSAPVLVRQGQGVGFSPYFMHRLPLFGADAHAFRPARWLPAENGGRDLKEAAGWAYLPFNGGPRRCLGEEFALLEASVAVVRVVQAFPALRLPEGEAVEAVGEERQELTLTLSPRDGCRVVLGEGGGK